jgi:PadR family transcriptional regulator PadR
MDIFTKLEELILLSVWKLGDNAYGTTIFKLISDVTGKKLSLGGIYFPLDRLVKKGYLNSFIGEATDERRGLSKRYYSLSELGLKSLEEIHRVNEVMWQDYSALSGI